MSLHATCVQRLLLHSSYFGGQFFFPVIAGIETTLADQQIFQQKMGITVVDAKRAQEISVKSILQAGGEGILER